MKHRIAVLPVSALAWIPIGARADWANREDAINQTNFIMACMVIKNDRLKKFVPDFDT